MTRKSQLGKAVFLPGPLEDICILLHLVAGMGSLVVWELGGAIYLPKKCSFIRDTCRGEGGVIKTCILGNSYLRRKYKDDFIREMIVDLL